MYTRNIRRWLEVLTSGDVDLWRSFELKICTPSATRVLKKLTKLGFRARRSLYETDWRTDGRA